MTLPLLDRLCRNRHIFRPNSAFAQKRIHAIKAKIDRDEPAYLAGVSATGMHNSGIALVEVTREGGPRLIFNNEEERFAAHKHTNAYPQLSIEALRTDLGYLGLDVTAIDGWFLSWDYAAFTATLIRALLEELPQSLSFLHGEAAPVFSLRDIDRGIRAPRSTLRGN